MIVHEKIQKRTDETDVKLSEFRSAYVIDGQHRIQGGNSAATNIYLPVTAFLGINREEQAFHFIVINRKARRVSKHDIDAVIPKSIYDGLQRRLVDAGIVSTDADIVFGLDNLDDSPFKGMIKWSNNVSASALISKGAIDALIKEARRLPQDELQSFEDNEIGLISAMWRGVRRHLGPLWDSEKYEKNPGETYDNQLLRKAAGVFPAIQRMLVNAFEQGAIKVNGSESDVEKEFEEAVYQYLKPIPLETFYCQWNVKSITNDSRVAELANLLTKAMRRKKVPYDVKTWFTQPESLEVVEQKRKLEREAKKKARVAKKKTSAAKRSRGRGKAKK